MSEIFDIRINPCKLSGTVEIPSSKSMTHRMIICAGLADGTSVLDNVSFSKDIYATLDAVKALGAEYSVNQKSITIKGIGKNVPQKAVIDCCESGSTLRFMIPVAAALGVESIFEGSGRLPQRPITPYIREMSANGSEFVYTENTMPFTVKGNLHSGKFSIEGDISSQFITGLLYALPLLDGDSEIILTSPLQSKPYADMTIDCLSKFGISISETEKGYFVKGNQKYKPFSSKVEGDYSQAAFFYVANAVGNNIDIRNLLPDSIQGDKKIVEIISDLCYNKNDSEYCINAENIPDLVPVLAVLGSLSGKVFRITNIERLKIKESDRIISTADMITAIGGKARAYSDSLVIEPVEYFTGGTVDSINDHRIVMAAAIAATRSLNDIVIFNANAVNKSYPDFFEDYNNIGGKANVINVE